MKRSKWTALTALLIATWTSTFATSNEMFTNSLPQTMEQSKSKPSDLYSRKDFNLPKEEATAFLTGSLLLMTPQIPFLPSNGVTSGSRISGGIAIEAGSLELSYTRLSSSFLFDTEHMLNEDQRLQLDAQFKLRDMESFVKVTHKLAFLGEGTTFQGIYGTQYTTTERASQYVYDKTPYSKKSHLSKFKGMGPLLGFEIEKPISKALSLVGGLSQSVLIGKSRWWEAKFSHYIPVTKTALGLNWTIGNERKSSLQLSPRYEAACYFNEGFIDTGYQYKKQSLLLQGLNLQATYNF